MQPADVEIVILPGTPIVKAVRINGIEIPNCSEATWTARPEGFRESLGVSVIFYATSIKTVEPDAE